MVYIAMFDYVDLERCLYYLTSAISNANFTCTKLSSYPNHILSKHEYAEKLAGGQLSHKFMIAQTIRRNLPSFTKDMDCPKDTGSTNF